MPQKSKFQEWLESDSYKHFVFDEGNVTNTTFIKVAKNDDFDYLFAQTFYSGSHIQRDDHLYFSGMYCKRDGQVYCAYNQLKRLIPEFEESKGQYAIENKIELIEQSRQHMHSVIDEHYNNLINSLKFGMNFSNIKSMLKQLLQDCNSEPKMHYGLVQLADNLYHDGKLLLGSNTEQMIDPIQIDDDLYLESDFDMTKLFDIVKDKVFSPIGYDCDMADLDMNSLTQAEDIIAPNLNL